MKQIKIGMIVFPGFQLLDIAGPRDAFSEVAVLSGGAQRYEILTVGTTRGSVQSSSGLTVVPDRTIFDPCPDFDTVVVPGGLGIFQAYDDPALSSWLRTHHRQARRIAAICNGVFALGAAGLIDRRTVTTHWMDVPRLAEAFPRTRIEPDFIYAKDGKVYTTAGVTAGIDLALVLIEEDFGRQRALDVAKYLVVYLRRAGGQSQFSPLLESLALPESQSARIQQHLLDNIHLSHSVASLAARVNMSARNLTRVFTRDCGIGPMAFLTNARLDAARRFLETTDMPIRDVARRCGFESVDGMRRVFQKRLQIHPAEYRDRFLSTNPLGTRKRT